MRFLWLLPPLAVGAVLRLWGLSRQILVGDEVHGLVSAVNLTVAEILTTYRLADHCIPLSVYYRLLMDSGVRLSETLIRAPAVLSGLAALAIFPLAVARWREIDGGWRRAAVMAWLLAVSPILVYYSRFARPYAEVVLLATLAAAAFWQWWRGDGHGWAVLYVAAGAASAWFFLGSAPFVAAPLLWAVAELAWRRIGRRGKGQGRGFLALAAVAAGIAAGIAGFLLAALPSFLRLVRRKAGGGSVEPGDLADLARLQAGTGWLALAVLFWGLAALGLAALLRRRPALGSFTLLLVIAQGTGIVLVLRPAGIGASAALGRYLLVCLPIVLLWVSEGVFELAERLGKRSRMAERGFLLACIGALALGSPFAADPALRLGPFAGAWHGLAIFEDPPTLPAAAVPAVYRQIAAEPGAEPVIEAILERTAIHGLRPTIALARHHRRPVILVSDDPWRSDPRLAFQTLVPADPRAIAGSGGRFVILQLDRPRLLRLQHAVERGEPMPGATSPDRQAVVLARELADELTRAWGEPHLTSGDVLLWDLARIR
ncbi:MAG TPA: hypothetical protein VM599_06470 [Thermoanaerobaculia bacterium]|nr:hypothetical protein [Thermoanaerobaculia bacterium]